MAEEELIKQLQEDFSFLERDERVLGVLLYGSKFQEEGHEMSDIDVCVVVPRADYTEVIRNVFRKVNIEERNYDVYAFEELPLYVKISIINEHQKIYCEDPYGLSEYFYKYRKLWRDQARRQKLTKKEIMEML